MMNLREKCKQTTDLINQSIQWVEKNIDNEESELLLSNLRDLRANSKNLETFSTGKPTLAIFGESQIGKSYFMSELLKNKEENEFYLTCKSPDTIYEKYFLNNYISFIKHINPHGTKESSGIVTRFTVSEDKQKTDAQIPVEFLNQVELALILSDTYALDIKNKSDLDNYEYSEIVETLQKLHLSRNQNEIDGLTESDLINFRNYLNKYLKDSSMAVQIFNKNKLWDNVITLLPRVPYSERYKVFELFWGQVPVFTQIFNTLSDVLKKINFTTTGHLELDALLPKEQNNRKSSVIDVGTIEEFLSMDKLRKINIHTPTSIISSIGIGEVAAITKEISLTVDNRVLNDNNRKFLNDIDILDFPGARGRKNYDISRVQSLDSFIVQSDEKENILHECIVRGKVHFLFNHYSDMNEITSLIFAQKNSNQEVNYIPKLIDNWVINTYGNKVEDRVGKMTNLFISFHFFNVDLNGKPSDIENEIEQYNSLWNSRLYTNVEQFIGTQIRSNDNWLQEWTPANNFKNFFFLRDPNPAFNTSTQIDITGNESYQPKYEQKHHDMKQSFLNNPYIKQYINNPLELWEASASLGNTGVEYIIKHISPVTTQIRREEQFTNKLDKTIMSILEKITPLFNSGNYEEDLKVVKQKTDSALKAILIGMKTKNSFGNLLDVLVLSEDLAWKTLYDIQNPIFEYADTSQAAIPNEDKSDMIDIDISEFEIDLDLNFDEFSEPSDQEDTRLDIYGKNKTKAEVFVDQLLSNWIESTDRNFNQDEVNKLGVSKEVITWILLNLRDSMLRVEFKKFLSQKLEADIDRYIQNQNSIFLVSRLCKVYFNNFINSYGWNHIPTSNRPVMQDDMKLFFRKVENFNHNYKVSALNHEDIQLTNSFPGKELLNHWLKGFQQATFLNLDYKYADGGAILNPKENEELRKIIEKLQE